MGYKFEVIYKNGSLTFSNGRERLINKCKELYWNEAPEDWASFDGDFSVQYRESIGIHDRAVIEFHSKEWMEIITRALINDPNVYSVKEI
ncbi:hypothetical protein DW228_16550 [Bacteroides fragilis]|jgi:hypothetical protein|uniref:Uncharacterized protein n=1 Tax=Bacteroides fragilis TaxID=817 RepID=A0A396BYM4_BACFG|nr:MULTISPECIES: hypothetical protein [Bacteroides]MCY6340517.1 hypothetical protein [Bacteroides fragilis]MDK2379915.1 hypothetical protein [Bacteroides fragilis]QCQ45831.1 hypothetical protein EC80_013675 [Bacteroides fragilis]QLK83210.1 hypothetical protein DBK98_014135 [Bacteroides sp. PHL 2737]RHH08804.1 hypothetical protein DW228_16550 [Bacteroides fragilis]